MQSGAGTTQSGFEITFALSNRSPLQHPVPADRRVEHPDPAGDHRGDGPGADDRAQRRRHDPPRAPLRRLARPPRSSSRARTSRRSWTSSRSTACPTRPCRPSPGCCCRSAKYAPLGVIPVPIPSLLEDIPIPIERIPRHQGTDLRVRPGAGQGGGLRLLHGPRSGAGDLQGVLGPRDPARRAPAGAEPDARRPAQQRRVAVVHLRQGAQGAPDRLHPGAVLEGADPDPDPRRHPAQPAAGRRAAAAAQITVPQGHREAEPPRARRCRASPTPSQHSDSVFGSGSLDVARYGNVLRSRSLVGVRGAGEAFDGLHYVTSVTSTLTRGEFTQSFSLARNALLSTVPKVPA